MPRVQRAPGGRYQITEEVRTGREVQSYYRQRGVRFYLARVGGRLQVRATPAGRLDEGDREVIREMEPQLRAALQAPQRGRPSQQPGGRPALPAERTQRERLRVTQEHRGAVRSYTELRDAIRAQGGIRANPDYPARLIPRDLRARAGRGLAPDEMALVLSEERTGLHYSGDVELFTDIERRRARVQETHEAYQRERPKTRGGQTVCSEVCRNTMGMFARCEAGARRFGQHCRTVYRDLIGRFRRR